jgi:hypothetical protein
VRDVDDPHALRAQGLQQGKERIDLRSGEGGGGFVSRTTFAWRTIALRIATS